MNRETEIAILNYDWLVRNHGLDAVELAFDSDTVVVGGGGIDSSELSRPGYTPATESYRVAD